MKPRSKPWPLPKLLAANRNAVIVYVTLRWMAGENRQLGTTRQQIRDVCGLYRDTISKALQCLHDARWISREYGREGNRVWYRISLTAGEFLPGPVQTRPRERRKSKPPKAGETRHKDKKNVQPPEADETRSRETIATGSNPLQGTRPCVGLNPPLPLTGEERPTAPALSHSVGAGADAPDTTAAGKEKPPQQLPSQPAAAPFEPRADDPDWMREGLTDTREAEPSARLREGDS